MKCSNGDQLFINGGYEGPLPASTHVLLTRPFVVQLAAKERFELNSMIRTGGGAVYRL